MFIDATGDTIESRIVAFIQRELLGDTLVVDRHANLLDDGMLDSIGVLRLAAFVDEEFRIGMQPADFVIEHFQSVAALVAYIRSTAGRGLQLPPETA